MRDSYEPRRPYMGNGPSLSPPDPEPIHCATCEIEIEYASDATRVREGGTTYYFCAPCVDPATLFEMEGDEAC